MVEKEIISLISKVDSDEKMWNFLAIVYAYGYDLHSKSNSYGSVDYDWTFFDRGVVRFYYAYQPIVKPMFINNLRRNFFLKKRGHYNDPRYIPSLRNKDGSVNWGFISKCKESLG